MIMIMQGKEKEENSKMQVHWFELAGQRKDSFPTNYDLGILYLDYIVAEYKSPKLDWLLLLLSSNKKNLYIELPNPNEVQSRKKIKIKWILYTRSSHQNFEGPSLEAKKFTQ